MQSLGLYPSWMARTWELSKILTAAQVKAQGTYISDKIDLLIEYLLVDPFQSLFRRAFKQDVRTLSSIMLQAGRVHKSCRTAAVLQGCQRLCMALP